MLRHSHCDCSWRSTQSLMAYLMALPPAHFVLEVNPASIFKRGDSMIGGEMPSFVVFSSGGYLALVNVIATKGFFSQQSLNCFFGDLLSRWPRRRLLMGVILGKWWFLIRDTYVAVTDLFSLANQCSRQEIRPHTDQSGAERIDSFFLSRTSFSSPFWSRTQSESTWVAAKKDLSHVLSNGHSNGRFSLKITLLLATHTKRASPAACHTSYLLQWHTSYKLKNQHTKRWHQKEPFLTLTQVYFCYRNEPFVVFQRSFVIYFELLINLSCYGN